MRKSVSLGKPDGEQAASVARQIGKWIDSAKYPLHSRLPPERELAAHFQIHRGRLREALDVLEGEGRIWRRVGMGTFVGSRPRSIRSQPETLGAATTLSEILEARSLVEPMVAGLAAMRAEQADIDMINRYAVTAAKSKSWAEWEHWDNLLHRAIAEASGNGLMINTIDQLLRIKSHPLWSVQRAPKFDPAIMTRYVNEHLAVISSIIGRDSERATSAMKKHMLGLTMTVGPIISDRARPAGK